MTKKCLIFIPTTITILILNKQMIYSENNIKFICKTGDALIERKLICDGNIDCYDKSDEINELCSRSVCSTNMFRCHYGACINQSKKCDGISDCADQSDETQCGRILNYSCAPNEFRCSCGQCILSQLICNGSPDCVDSSDETPQICHPNYLCPWKTFRCKNGGCIQIVSQCNGISDCLDGSDESNELCDRNNQLNNNSCPPILSKRLDAICRYNNTMEVSCDQKQLPGTIVEYSCKKYYVIKYEWDINNILNECQQDGRWFRPILTCIPDCGRHTLLQNSQNITETFPWQVQIYIQQTNNYYYYKYRCGATLISETHAITAAHCIWNQKYESIKLIIGKSSYGVKQIFIHPLYFDNYGNYGSDIAIIKVIGFVKFSDEILPICIGCNLNLQLPKSEGKILRINNWTKDNVQYKLIRLNVIPNIECLQSNLQDFWKFITISTFCAGWNNGSELCNGDSGTGLIFPIKKTDQWCLQGIVSLSSRNGTSLRCNQMSYTIFTNVNLYLQWIKNILTDSP